MSQDNGPTPMPSGDEAEAQSDLRETINERRNQEVEITNENIDSIILEASQTVAKEQDLRERLTSDTPTAEEEDTKHQEEPRTEEGELAPTSNKMSNVIRYGFNPEPWPRPFREAIYEERDKKRSLTPPSPIYPRHDDPEMIPQTPPRDQNSKKPPSPIIFNASPRRPIKDRLGERPHNDVNRRQDHYQNETPRRPVKDRLGIRRSKQKN